MFWLTVIALILITLFYLRGQDLSRYDWPKGQSFATGDNPSAEHQEVVTSLREGFGALQSSGQRRSRSEKISGLRAYMDAMSDMQEIDADIRAVDVSGIDAEWVLASGADANRRVLYIHGGGFIVGSPKSHRNITSKFSRIADAAVLAIDYRLMPEHPRRAGIDDCRRAYQWILNNGPDGPAAAEVVFVGGDSAGGNLTLSLLGWLRTHSLPQPAAAVALSPLTDGTFASPSWQTNLQTDAMLGPMFGKLAKVPRWVLLWLGLWQNRMNPSNPAVSPVFGDLSDLPPTLVHASEAEMLLDDARRYVNKAAAAGSPVTLQTWPHVVHVWHIFHPRLPEAVHAWEEIEAFIAGIDADRQKPARQATRGKAKAA